MHAAPSHPNRRAPAPAARPLRANAMPDPHQTPSDHHPLPTPRGQKRAPPVTAGARAHVVGAAATRRSGRRRQRRNVRDVVVDARHVVQPLLHLCEHSLPLGARLGWTRQHGGVNSRRRQQHGGVKTAGRRQNSRAASKQHGGVNSTAASTARRRQQHGGGDAAVDAGLPIGAHLRREPCNGHVTAM